jgi:hypothetical protein
MDVEAAFVADGKPPELVEPGKAALDDPSMAAKSLACLDASPSDAGFDLTADASASATTVIVGLVGVQLVRSASWSASLACHRRDGVDQLLERHAVVDVGSSQYEGERNAAAIGDQVPLGAWSASIGGVRACRRTPLFAAMDELSTQARLQSIPSASCNRRSNSRCRRSHTPAVCQSRSRRQQVTPEPHPISNGSISQGMPVRRTKRIPVSAARDGTAGRPPFGFGVAGGSRGSMISHKASGRSGLGIPPHESTRARVQGF